MGPWVDRLGAPRGLVLNVPAGTLVAIRRGTISAVGLSREPEVLAAVWRSEVVEVEAKFFATWVSRERFLLRPQMRKHRGASAATIVGWRCPCQQVCPP